MIGKIHSIETFGSVDGPGIRFIAFMQGCNMRCRFCHNPDTWKKDAGEEIEPAALLERALRYRDYWGKKGGITVSGGEPLLQMDFVTEFFRLAKEMNIHTCLDTSGLPYRNDLNDSWHDNFLELMTYTDLVLLDIKHIEDTVHKKLTGFTNRNILSMAEELKNINKPVWIRHVLLENPGDMTARLSDDATIDSDTISELAELCDTEESLHQLHDFMEKLPNIERVDVLPYHTLGTFKYEKLCLPYTLAPMNPPSKEWIQKAGEILKL